MKVFVTGCAGFIGNAVAERLLLNGNEVVGLDSLSDYYSKDLKLFRIKRNSNNANFKFVHGDICDQKTINEIFSEHKFDVVLHLAAQAGVRLPLEKSSIYIDSNIQGFLNIMRGSIESKVSKFLYASSSSVYGDEAEIPYVEHEKNLNPNSIYGLTKLADEKIAQILSRSTGIKSRGLRFFTVYGPLGRPDMAYFRLIACALTGIHFNLNGDGSVKRDFTFIDDIVNSIMLLESELDERAAGFSDVVNIGGGNPVSISYLINKIEQLTNRRISINQLPENPSDVKETCANFSYLYSLTKQKPNVLFDDGILQTLIWATSCEIQAQIKSWTESVR
jgi:UDP-glucuronate 4-epimerase